MDLSMDLWHSSNIKVTLHKFANDHFFFNSLNIEVCWLYSLYSIHYNYLETVVVK